MAFVLVDGGRAVTPRRLRQRGGGGGDPIAAVAATLRRRQPHGRSGRVRMELAPNQRNFIQVDNLSSDELRYLLKRAVEIKPRIAAGEYKPMASRSMAMVFAKPSARTRVSFETGMFMMGGHALHLGEEIGIGKREATKDIARVMSGYNDILMARLYKHSDLEELAAYSRVPVINGLTDYNHPCQIVADALTVTEELGSVENRKIVFVGEGNNVVVSWLELATRLPIDFVCLGPEGYEPPEKPVKVAREAGLSEVTVSSDIDASMHGADVVYADVWASMGQKDSLQDKLKAFQPYQVNAELMKKSGKDSTIFMHCLPAERGYEVTDEVIESPASKVFPQAANRMHAQNAITLHCLGLL